MRPVADHAQFVVQIVLTTSSKTVGLRKRRPAPAVATQASAPAPSPRAENGEGIFPRGGLIAAGGVERGHGLLEPEGREAREPVGSQRPARVGGLAAGADELELELGLASLPHPRYRN